MLNASAPISRRFAILLSGPSFKFSSVVELTSLTVSSKSRQKAIFSISGWQSQSFFKGNEHFLEIFKISSTALESLTSTEKSYSPSISEYSEPLFRYDLQVLHQICVRIRLRQFLQLQEKYPSGGQGHR